MSTVLLPSRVELMAHVLCIQKALASVLGISKLKDMGGRCRGTPLPSLRPWRAAANQLWADPIEVFVVSNEFVSTSGSSNLLWLWVFLDRIRNPALLFLAASSTENAITA